MWRSGGEGEERSCFLRTHADALLTLCLTRPCALGSAADFKNVSIVGHYIKDRTKNAQFVIISLRNNMFELVSEHSAAPRYRTSLCAFEV